MPRFSVHLEIFLFPLADGTFKWDTSIIPDLRTQASEYILQAKIFELTNLRTEEEYLFIDEKGKLEFDLKIGAESPVEIPDKIADLLRWIRLKARDKGLAEQDVRYEILADW